MVISELPPAVQGWLQEYNTMVEALVQSGFQPTPATTRSGMASLTAMMVTDSPEVDLVRDGTVAAGDHTVPVRIYHPVQERDLPVLVYFHGGGGVAGSVSVYDAICRKMAIACKHVVVSVEYRLAPENPYPCGLQDGQVVVEQIWPFLQQMGIHHQPRLSIGGDSAGGGLSASLAHLNLGESGVEIDNLILIYPSVDYTMTMPSVTGVGDGYLLNQEKIQWYLELYFQKNDDRKKASPLYMDCASGFPRTLVITAEYCPLKDEGVAYYEKILEAGGAARHLHFDDMIHAFLNLENIASRQCRALYTAMAAFLKN